MSAQPMHDDDNAGDGRKSNVLTGAQMYRLCQLVEAEFVKAGVADHEFANRASMLLAFPVTGQNVARARTILGIQSRRVSIASRDGRRNFINEMTSLARIVVRLVDELGVELRPVQRASLNRMARRGGDDEADE